MCLLSSEAGRPRQVTGAGGEGRGRHSDPQSRALGSPSKAPEGTRRLAIPALRPEVREAGREEKQRVFNTFLSELPG